MAWAIDDRTPTSKLTDVALACCVLGLKHQLGITAPSDEAVRDLVETSPQAFPYATMEGSGSLFVESMNEFYNKPTGTFDTAEREFLWDIVAYKFVGREWPTNGDNVGFNQFIAELEEGVRKAGWQIISA